MSSSVAAHMSASLIGHGLCTRFPQLRFAPVENGSGWVRPLIDALQSAYATSPQIFEEDPVEVERLLDRADGRLADMDDAGIDLQVLSVFAPAARNWRA